MDRRTFLTVAGVGGLTACTPAATDYGSPVTPTSGATATSPPPAVAGSSPTPASGQVAATPGRVGHDDPHIRYSPFSWRRVEGEHRGSSGAMVSALLRSKTVAVEADTAGTVAVRVNGGSWAYASGSAVVPVALERGQSWGTNLVDVVLIDSWGAFRGFRVDGDGSALPVPDPGSPRILTLGDSITEGNSVGPAGTAHTTNALLAYPAALRDVLGAEVGVSASGGRGWLTNSPLRDTWSDAGGATMDFSRPPDAIVVMAGGGEPDAPGLAAAVRATLQDMQARLPTTHVLVLGHTNTASPAVATINRAARALVGPRVHFVDAAGWVNAQTDTTDGVHHAGWVGRAIMAPHVARVVRQVLRLG